jgi:hypothetical protein
VHRWRDNREKIISLIFAALRAVLRSSLAGVCRGLIENLHRAHPRARGIGEKETRVDLEVLVDLGALSPVAVDKQREAA